MKRNSDKCTKCGRIISLSNYDKHLDSCKGKVIIRCFEIKEEYKQDDGKYKCPECGKAYSKYGLVAHYWSKHTEDGIKFRSDFILRHNPNIGFKLGTRTIWNKGLNKKNNESLKKASDTLKKRYADGTLIAFGKGKILSNEHKKKISEGIKNAHKNGNHTGWKHINGDIKRRSYPEKYFIKLLENNNLTNKYRITEKKSIGKYFLDFAFEDYMVDFEIDGCQHFRSQEAIDHDLKRDEFLKRNGWSTYRVKWSDLKDNSEIQLQKLLQFVEKHKDSILIVNNNKLVEAKIYLCKKCGVEIVGCGKTGLCSRCVKIKVERPSKEELEKMISEIPMTRIGLKYGVSNSAIKKWCRDYGIELENRRGYWAKKHKLIRAGGEMDITQVYET